MRESQNMWDGSAESVLCYLSYQHVMAVIVTPPVFSKSDIKFLPRKNGSSWALMRSTLPLLSSAVCPCHTCDLGISSDERHGYNGPKQRRQRMVDATWETAEIHLHNLVTDHDSGPVHSLFLLPVKLITQTSLISFRVLLKYHLLRQNNWYLKIWSWSLLKVKLKQSQREKTEL